MPELFDMTGHCFGKWKVLRRGCNTKHGGTQWVCECECGNLGITKGSHLREKRSTQCRECHDRFTHTKHGLYKSSEYHIWEAMIQRCHNPHNRAFKDYGNRGVEVCKEWREDFVNFFTDMGKRGNNLSLDRIDNDKGYFKENCRWTSRKTQQRNTRRSFYLGDIYNGWELLSFIDNKNSSFKCIKCGKIRKSERTYVRQKAVPHKCK